MLEFVKNYFIFLLILYLFSYLAPQESYRKYLHFFVSVLMIAVLMKPVLTLFQSDAREQTKVQLERIYTQLDNYKYVEKGEDVFAWYWEHEGMDDKTVEDKE